MPQPVHARPPLAVEPHVVVLAARVVDPHREMRQRSPARVDHPHRHPRRHRRRPQRLGQAIERPREAHQRLHARRVELPRRRFQLHHHQLAREQRPHELVLARRAVRTTMAAPEQPWRARRLQHAPRERSRHPPRIRHRPNVARGHQQVIRVSSREPHRCHRRRL